MLFCSVPPPLFSSLRLASRKIAEPSLIIITDDRRSLSRRLLHHRHASAAFSPIGRLHAFRNGAFFWWRFALSKKQIHIFAFSLLAGGCLTVAVQAIAQTSAMTVTPLAMGRSTDRRVRLTAKGPNTSSQPCWPWHPAARSPGTRIPGPRLSLLRRARSPPTMAAVRRLTRPGKSSTSSPTKYTAS